MYPRQLSFVAPVEVEQVITFDDSELYVVVQGEMAEPAPSVSLRLVGDRGSLSAVTDVDGVAKFYLPSATYYLEINGLNPQIVAIAGDIQLIVSLPVEP